MYNTCPEQNPHDILFKYDHLMARARATIEVKEERDRAVEQTEHRE